jgi:SPP1 family predicted phage head-tail adaptor
VTPTGELDTRVTIWERSILRAADGDATPQWSQVAARWAKVEPGSGREVWQAGQARPDITHTVTLRSYPDLSPRHQLRIGSRVLNVESAIHLEDTVCACREEV